MSVTKQDGLKELIQRIAPSVDFWSARKITSLHDELSVRKGILEQARSDENSGIMISVCHQGGFAYAASSDLSAESLRSAFEHACSWAALSAKHSVFNYKSYPFLQQTGEYHTPVAQDWAQKSMGDKISWLMTLAAKLKTHDNIIDWSASATRTLTQSYYFCSQGSDVRQEIVTMQPNLRVIANKGAVTQSRSLFGGTYIQQGGLEVAERLNLDEEAGRIAQEALQLLDAPNCPTKKMDLLLHADQMLLQIHESIGHPLELDRILGDERNYAGTSFVTMDMFGKYQYGSSLLNVTFDPKVNKEAASYAFDDDGSKAEKVHLIKEGILQKPLGGSLSQYRANCSGVANSRACSWNRPPIDRMANLNVEPGASSFADMISAVEDGILMRANCSWSIDDSRNKFQFGCEWGQLIEKGRLTQVVRNPNYRGISSTFWRNLKMVGDKNTWHMLAANNCGKGEPNQAIMVGHASPACLFTSVDVFGGI